jgi:putative hydrolase of the HAD superfamily
VVEAFAGVKGVYFDLDDTLCAYWDASKAGLRATFDLCPVLRIGAEEMTEHWAAAFRGFCPHLRRLGWYERYLKESQPTRTELMRLTLERAGVEDPELADRLSQTYLQQRDCHLRLFPDATVLLDALEGRLPLGLITNGPADLQRMEIATLRLGPRFQHIFVEGEMGFGKPEPAVFRQAQEAMGLRPAEILFVGNSYGHDIRPAIEAGWRTAWVRRPSDVPPSAKGIANKPEELPAGAPPPDVTVSDLRELLRP